MQQRRPDAVREFLDEHCVRCLVTPREHSRLGKAKAGATQSTLGLLEPMGANHGRYRAAGIELVALDGPQRLSDRASAWRSLYLSGPVRITRQSAFRRSRQGP